MTLDISKMTISDYPTVLALWRSVEGVGLHEEESDSPEGIARYLARNPGMSFVARIHGQTVGAVLCGHDGRRGYLNHLAVAASQRRKGIATALIGRCLRALGREGIAKCNLFVFAANEPATAFWRRLGWRDYADGGIAAMSRAVEQEVTHEHP